MYEMVLFYLIINGCLKKFEVGVLLCVYIYLQVCKKCTQYLDEESSLYEEWGISV